jgi:F-box domain
VNRHHPGALPNAWKVPLKFQPRSSRSAASGTTAAATAAVVSSSLTSSPQPIPKSSHSASVTATDSSFYCSPSSASPGTGSQYGSPHTPGDSDVHSDPHIVGSSRWRRTTPLSGVLDMFGDTFDADVIQSVFQQVQYNADAAIEHLLAMSAALENKDDQTSGLSSGAPHATAAVAGPANVLHFSSDQLHKKDLLTSLPNDALLMICDMLDHFALASLRCVSRASYEVVQQVFESVNDMNFYRYWYWPDWRMLNMLKQFPQLQTVSLRACEGFESFEQLAHILSRAPIYRVNLSGCYELTDRGALCLISQVPNLMSLDVSHTAVTNSFLEHMPENAPQLSRLNLNTCVYITDNGVSRLLRSMKNLQYLDLRHCPVSSAALSFETKDCSLQQLFLRGCEYLRNLVIHPRFYCPINNLNASFNTNLTTVSLALPELRTLNLSNCKRLQRLVLHTPELEDLMLSCCPNLQVIQVTGSTSLTRVNAFSCRQIQPRGVVELAKSGKHTLQSLNLTGCMSISESTVEQLIDHCSELVDLTLNGCKNVPQVHMRRFASLLRQRKSRYEEKQQHQEQQHRQQHRQQQQRKQDGIYDSNHVDAISSLDGSFSQSPSSSSLHHNLMAMHSNSALRSMLRDTDTSTG